MWTLLFEFVYIWEMYINWTKIIFVTQIYGYDVNAFFFIITVLSFLALYKWGKDVKYGDSRNLYELL